jgi:DNA ligase D-like protein (predicted 3'-phosphoesterase)
MDARGNSPATADSLAKYRSKRSPDRTPEPFGGVPTASGNLFVVHKHAARNLHFDLRLEMDGVLRSWAVPKGPSYDQAEKRLAVKVEDHPLEYGDFEGVIPAGNYGAGGVIVWDRGEWVPLEDWREGLEKGKLAFELKLDGYRLLAAKRGHDVVLLTRNGLDYTDVFPEVARAMKALPHDACILDGEVVAMDPQGKPSFARLQRRGRLTNSLDIGQAAVELPATFFAFDLLAFDDYDLRGVARVARRRVGPPGVP